MMGILTLSGSTDRDTAMPSADTIPFAVTRRPEQADTFVAAPEKCLSGSGEQMVWNAFSDPSGQFHVGHWQGACGRLKVAYTEQEFCVLLSGTVRLEQEETGTTATFTDGDAFVIPKGFKGVWETVESVKKFYVIHTPKGTA